MSDVFHYPPDLFDLLVQAIPLLNRSKKSVLLFFKGAGINESIFEDISKLVENKKDSITKYDICRNILERINQNTDKYLRERREILKRVTEFESFATCWEDDRLKAKGLIAEIQNVVNVKDSFTRMKEEREREVLLKQKEYAVKIEEIQKKKDNISRIKSELFSLFSEKDHQKRGKALEKILNDFFRAYQILVKEDFKRVGNDGDGIVEQIDGIVEIDNQIFLVEMKWRNDAIGNNDIYAHLGRIYHRADAHGIYISASEYTSSGLLAAKEGLVKNALLVLFDLKELVRIMEVEADFMQYLRKKIRIAIIEKEPYKKLIQ